MGSITGIEWTDHTLNPWIGCTAVSPACDHCYAKTWVNGRMGGDFDQRRRTAPATWNAALKWNREATAENRRHRVFCASLADVFDNKVPPEWRDDLWDLIRVTPMLDWQLLTKRPQNIAKMLPVDWGRGFRNVWLGTTVENQTEADRRIPHLLAVPTAVRFLSCEPLLGPVDLRNIYQKQTLTDALDGMSESPVINCGDRMVAINPKYKSHAAIDWVIVGGEAGGGSRPMMREWARSLRDQCYGAKVPMFFKQWGDHVPEDDAPDSEHTSMRRVGKKAAGNVLDGRIHREWPTPNLAASAASLGE